MTDTDGTSQDTGSSGTLEEAAKLIASKLPDLGDSDGGETQEATASEEADETEEPSEDDADESEDAEDDKDPDEQPTLYTVKVDGQEQQVTLEEALKGYQREQDYTRKTMGLSDDRKAFDAEKAQVAQERETYANALKRMEEFFTSAADDSQELAQLRYSNPAEYAARIAEKQERQQSLQLLKTEQQRLADQKSREEAQTLAQYAKAEEDKLLVALPEWLNADTRKADQAKLVDYAINSLGLSPDEVGQIYDHRLVMALHKAAKWDALQAKKPTVQAKVDAVKTAKPGSAANQPTRVTEITRSKQRLAKTGRVQDAAAAIEQLLG